jgi:hypothetical protein
MSLGTKGHTVGPLARVETGGPGSGPARYHTPVIAYPASRL